MHLQSYHVYLSKLSACVCVCERVLKRASVFMRRMLVSSTFFTSSSKFCRCVRAYPCAPTEMCACKLEYVCVVRVCESVFVCAFCELRFVSMPKSIYVCLDMSVLLARLLALLCFCLCLAFWLHKYSHQNPHSQDVAKLTYINVSLLSCVCLLKC